MVVKSPHTVSPPRVPPRYVTDSLNAVLNTKTGKVEEYRHLIKGKDAARWMEGNTREIARLCHGRRKDNSKGSKTIRWLHPGNLSPGRVAKYLRVVSSYQPNKADPYRIRWTVGGNNIIYPGPVHTPTGDITTFKCLANSVISTLKAKFADWDLKDFYLDTPMPQPEYMYVPRQMVPQEIIDKYNLEPLFRNDIILAKINKGMYGLPQAGRLAYNRLWRHLAKAGYIPTGTTPGLWKHITNNIKFILVEDDFGVKLTDMKHATHLLNHLRSLYTLTTD